MAPAPLVPSTWRLPDAFRRRLGARVGMQRVMHDEGHLVIVAHDVPGSNERHRRGVLFWRKPDGSWAASNGDVGNIAIELLLKKYDEEITQFELDEVQAQDAKQYLRVVEGLSPVARSIQNLSSVLQDARKHLPEATELIDLRDRAYELARTAQLNYQMTRDAMDVSMIRRSEENARIADRQAQATHRLNLLAAFFLPLATISGIFGTTLTDNWPWAESFIPFLLMLGFGLMSGSVLVLVLASAGAKPEEP